MAYEIIPQRFDQKTLFVRDKDTQKLGWIAARGKKGQYVEWTLCRVKYVRYESTNPEVVYIAGSADCANLFEELRDALLWFISDGELIANGEEPEIYSIEVLDDQVVIPTHIVRLPRRRNNGTTSPFASVQHAAPGGAAKSSTE